MSGNVNAVNKVAPHTVQSASLQSATLIASIAKTKQAMTTLLLCAPVSHAPLLTALTFHVS